MTNAAIVEAYKKKTAIFEAFLFLCDLSNIQLVAYSLFIK